MDMIWPDVKHKERRMANMEKKKNSGVSAVLEHIMGGIGYMIPCIVAGGILMAIGYMLDDFSINPDNYGYNLPAASFFSTIGNASFRFMLPVLAAFIGQHIAGNSAGIGAGTEYGIDTAIGE